LDSAKVATRGRSYVPPSSPQFLVQQIASLYGCLRSPCAPGRYAAEDARERTPTIRNNGWVPAFAGTTYLGTNLDSRIHGNDELAHGNDAWDPSFLPRPALDGGTPSDCPRIPLDWRLPHSMIYKVTPLAARARGQRDNGPWKGRSAMQYGMTLEPLTVLACALTMRGGGAR
jgi:hypothetical protein